MKVVHSRPPRLPLTVDFFTCFNMLFFAPYKGFFYVQEGIVAIYHKASHGNLTIHRFSLWGPHTLLLRHKKGGRKLLLSDS